MPRRNNCIKMIQNLVPFVNLPGFFYGSLSGSLFPAKGLIESVHKMRKFYIGPGSGRSLGKALLAIPNIRPGVWAERGEWYEHLS